MDVLIKFSKKIFDKECHVKGYLLCELPKQENYFHLKQKLSKKVKTIYFSFDGRLVAKAKYISHKIDKYRMIEYQNGYKIENLIVFGDSKKIKSSIFKGRIINYIKDKKQKKYIKKLLKDAVG
jgi:hypothetical protein